MTITPDDAVPPDDRIPPDQKDWTWVLERGCDECGFDSRACPREQVGDRLRANVEDWVRVLEGDPVELARRARADRWSPVEYACHVRDVFRLFDRRLKSLLTLDAPRFANWDRDRAALEEGYHGADPAEVSRQLPTPARR